MDGGPSAACLRSVIFLENTSLDHRNGGQVAISVSSSGGARICSLTTSGTPVRCSVAPTTSRSLVEWPYRKLLPICTFSEGHNINLLRAALISARCFISRKHLVCCHAVITPDSKYVFF